MFDLGFIFNPGPKYWIWRKMLADVEVLLRHVPLDEYNAIAKDCVEVSYATGQKSEVRNDKKFYSLLARAAVKDWRNIVNDGTPFPCTPENIDLLVERCADFRLMVTQVPFSAEWFANPAQEPEEEIPPAAGGPGEVPTE